MYVCIHTYIEKLKVLVSHLCPALCNPMSYSLPSSSIHGILQASILEWIAIPFCRESSQPRDWTRSPVLQSDSLLSEPPGTAAANHFSRVRLCATPQMAAHQASLSLGFSRQEHWSGLPFPPPMHESEKWKWSRSVVSDSSNPMDCSPSGSSIHGILQARVLEWGAIAFSEPPGKPYIYMDTKT